MPSGPSLPTFPTSGGAPDGPLVLPLPLRIGPARPGPIEPERATPCGAAFDDPDWRFSVDWQGMRAILRAGTDGGVRIHDERLKDVTARLPEIAAAGATALRGRAAALDGVVAALDSDGCPDLPALAGRLWSSAARAPRPGRASGGGATQVVMLVTDLLHLDGASLHAWPFDRRRQALAALLAPAPHLQLPDWVEGQGRALAAAAAERWLPAVVGRHGAAPYHPGATSPLRLRVALRDETEAVVTAVVPGPRGGVDALVLAEWEGGRLVAAGRVPFDGHAAAARWLSARAQALRVSRPEPVDAVEEPGAVWMRASVVATLRHHGRIGSGALRLASLVAVREDVDPRGCVRRRPVPPPVSRAAAEPAAFRPTVIATLPLTER